MFKFVTYFKFHFYKKIKILFNTKKNIKLQINHYIKQISSF